MLERFPHGEAPENTNRLFSCWRRVDQGVWGMVLHEGGSDYPLDGGQVRGVCSFGTPENGGNVPMGRVAEVV